MVTLPLLILRPVHPCLAEVAIVLFRDGPRRKIGFKKKLCGYASGRLAASTARHHVNSLRVEILRSSYRASALRFLLSACGLRCHIFLAPACCLDLTVFGET